MGSINIPGIIIFTHKQHFDLIYCGASDDMLSNISNMIEDLFMKKESELNTLEAELKNYPYADQWLVALYTHKQEELNLNLAKSVITHQSLKPYGLNDHLEIEYKDNWMEFLEWAKNK